MFLEIGSYFVDFTFFLQQIFDTLQRVFIHCLRRGYYPIPFWLSSICQCLIYSINRLHVPPFISDFLSLACCFPLLHVTMDSSAVDFTITTASSADPRFITLALLRRLGLKVSHLHRPESDGPSLGKIVNSVSIHLPSTPQHFTMRISGFGGCGQLTPVL